MPDVAHGGAKEMTGSPAEMASAGGDDATLRRGRGAPGLREGGRRAPAGTATDLLAAMLTTVDPLGEDPEGVGKGVTPEKATGPGVLGIPARHEKGPGTQRATLPGRFKQVQNRKDRPHQKTEPGRHEPVRIALHHRDHAENQCHECRHQPAQVHNGSRHKRCAGSMAGPMTRHPGILTAAFC